jgi:hypothetical protein
MKSRKTLLGALAISYAVVIALESPAMGKPLFVKKAKELGYPATSCLYCHTVKLPKKEEARKQFNDRGKWLLSEKVRLGEKEVDLGWLKNYPGGPEQK